MNNLSTRLALALLTAATLALPAQAQNPMQLLQSIRQGGGWLAVPITDGAGEIATDTIPTFGLAVKGCLTIWPGHSGSWTVKVQDPLSDQRLDAETLPGVGVPFSYQGGPRSALDVQIGWSEPRDTTLLVWVGVDTGNPDRDACEPVYPERGGAPRDLLPRPR